MKKKKLKEANLLKNLRTFEVSLVDNGAIGEEFTIIKREDPNEEDEEIKQELGDKYQDFVNSLEENLKKQLDLSDNDEIDSVLKSDEVDEKEESEELFEDEPEIAEEENVKKNFFGTLIKKVFDFVSNKVTDVSVEKQTLDNNFWDSTEILRISLEKVSEYNVSDDVINQIVDEYSSVIKQNLISKNELFIQSIAKSNIDLAIDSLINDQEILKVGKKISSSRISRLKQAADLINQILSESEAEVMKAEDVTKMEEIISKAVNPLLEKIAELETKLVESVKKNEEVAPVEEQATPAQAEEQKLEEQPAANTELETKIEELTKRLENYEKQEEQSRKLLESSVSKQDTHKSSMWPSFQVNK